MMIFSRSVSIEEFWAQATRTTEVLIPTNSTVLKTWDRDFILTSTTFNYNYLLWTPYLRQCK